MSTELPFGTQASRDAAHSYPEGHAPPSGPQRGTHFPGGSPLSE